ncbi:MAG: DUF4845 domain-containing protein [Gammaproteobacteria bacterium]
MLTKNKQKGVTFLGFLIVCGLLIFFAYLGMRLWPVYNEKLKVDGAMETVAARADISKLSKNKIGSYILRTFSVEDVDQFATLKDMKDVFSVKRIKGKKKRLLRMAYDIRRPVISNLDVVMKYDKSIEIDGTGQ